jgi:hypothetical protein
MAAERVEIEAVTHEGGEASIGRRNSVAPVAA